MAYQTEENSVQDELQKPSIEEGEYQVVVIDAEEKVSKSGYPQIQLKLEVQAGPANGKVIYDWLTYTEKARWRVEQALTSMGIHTDDGVIEVKAPELIGARAVVRVKHREWQGETRANVDRWIPPNVRRD